MRAICILDCVNSRLSVVPEQLDSCMLRINKLGLSDKSLSFLLELLDSPWTFKPETPSLVRMEYNVQAKRCSDASRGRVYSDRNSASVGIISRLS